MIIDSIQNASKYYAVHPRLAKAFDYINRNWADLSTMKPGKYEIDGVSLKAIISNNKGLNTAESISKFKFHNKYIYIQFLINGIETMGWKPRENCQAPK